jgi:hypothetical protein
VASARVRKDGSFSILGVEILIYSGIGCCLGGV